MIQGQRGSAAHPNSKPPSKHIFHSLLIMNDLADAVEHLFVIWLHLNGVRSLAKHQK